MSFVCMKTHGATFGSASQEICVTRSLVGTGRPNLFTLILKRTDCLRLACRPLIAKTATAISGWDFMKAEWRAIAMDTFDFSLSRMVYLRALSELCFWTTPDGCGPRPIRAESSVSTIRKRNTQALTSIRPQMD